MPYCSCKSKIKVNDSPLRKTWMVNMAAKKKLGLDLEVLTRRSQNQWSKLNHALHKVEQQLEQTEDEARKPSILPVEKFLSNVKPAVKDSTFSWEDRNWTFLCKKSKCLQFPCIKPEKYHTIGFRPEVCDDRWASWEEIQPVYADYVEFEKKSILRNTKNTPSINISDREAYLKKEWLSKRSENYKCKPEPWEINYGKPVPGRLLKYPVRFIPNVAACSRLFY
ncbi:uncharacterized protein LOC121371361 [Gigantopelta aegis]|uniref:uncharacterized protein LOC121371361 n=1 Tax=Gigantopelta aegis TaxID=1735272 RepID=UPI001B88CE08|nr:uncharacterized protein LOC121371361 [Gigantopelta aegis]